VGSGGAGKAAKAAAESLGFTTTVINRTQHTPEIKPLSAFRDEFLKADIIIYNLPVRIDRINELTDEDISTCGRKVILEANYRNPSFDNSLTDRWKNINPEIEYIDGKEWLLAQAVTGYELFTGEQPDSDAMRGVLL
jgi:shikimate 5-dehydrogenase